MLKITTNTEYFAKKQALLEALRHFYKNRFDNLIEIECTSENEGYEQFSVTFSKEALIKQLGFNFTMDYMRLVKETEPENKQKMQKQGKLYHKNDILRIYENSIISKSQK